ncbi:SusC/RagA family TonB-linked outer membrane protein [Sphingobacterium daejeonense]|uniref:SusC/RagA family TonB-linked outer membrane protein n=2 Tax=Sphingobacterium daejeonense TaxID=371142 RepID=UPI0021A69D17|nr:SusC/RagA family TonB-linked outer membrane protein [Sphingobacterium daejeonense]MCT1532525.1 SusC/RagA family TonB-linked outer membrane protein [Sphingobacterium daejeonense]
MQHFLATKILVRKKRMNLSICAKAIRFSILCMLLLACSNIVKASDQLITLKFQKAKLNVVLNEITQQTKYQFFYNDQINRIAGPITVNINRASVSQVLEMILPNDKLEYSISNNQITIIPKKTKPIESTERLQEIISGTVKDLNGNPLIGASITIKGTNTSTTTNNQGEFQIIAKPSDIVVISFQGFKRLEVSVAGRKSLSIAMTTDQQALEAVDVVATGYQTIDRRKFTGAATKVKAEDAQRFGVPDVSRMLEGQVSGVSVQNVSGTFGAAPKIRVRGATSITGDNKPLWVVDGIILEDVVNISNDQLSTGDASTLLGSSVAGINPDDIESFEILKDAAATSLYGARAMNGVIIITTKKGKAGTQAVSYLGNFTTYLKPSYSQFDIVNSYDQMSVYAELARKGAIDYALIKNNRNSGIYGILSRGLSSWNKDGTPVIENSPEGRAAFLKRYNNINTDWFGTLFNNSLLQEHSISFSNGNEKVQTYYSTSFLQDNGWTKSNGVRRYTANIRGNYTLNKNLNIGLLTTGSIRDQRAPGTLGQNSNPVTGVVSRDFDINPFSYAMNTSRVIAPFDVNGNREFITMNYAPFNILDELDKNYMDLKMIDLKVQGELNYKLPKNIKFNMIGAYRYASTGNEHKINETSNLPNAYRAGTEYGVEGIENSIIADANRFLYRNPENPDARPTSVLPYGGMYITSENLLKSFYLRNSLTWSETFGKNYFTAFATQEMRYLDRMSKEATGYGYQFDKGGVPFIDPRIIKMNVEGNMPYYKMEMFSDRFIALAMNGTYSFDSRYQFTGTARYDGSNQLGRSKVARWLPTWNLSGSWNIDQENFMQNQNFFNTLTIRGTYGLTASMGPATNASLVLRSATVNRPFLREQEPVINIEYLENNELTWEKQYETNIGIDATFANRRYQVVLDFYKRDAFDLIGPIRVSGIGAEAIKIANYADMKSNGIEVLFKATVFDRKDWGWKTQLTNAFYNNEITYIKNEPRIWNLVNSVGAAKEGYPHRGLFSIDFEKLNKYNGTPTYVNEDGDISNNVFLQSIQTNFLIYEGPVDPTFNGGFYNNFNYKNLNLSFLVTYSAGNKVRLNPIYKNSYSELDAMSYDFLDRFVAPYENLSPSIATVRTDARLTGNQVYNAYNYSNARVADGGFVRMKQITLGYELPKKFLGKSGFNNISLNIVANNLFLIYSDPKLNGQDPEFYGTGGVAMPIPRQFTLSLKAGL